MSFQNSLGLLLVILFVLRKWGGYQEYIGISLFWSASKILLGLTLLWTYHLFAFFITFWYGRLEVEESILRYLMFESYAPVFWANVLFSFIVPFLLLLWNPVRKSAWGPALAGLSALVGGFLFSIRIFVGSFNSVEFQPLPGGGELYSLGLGLARIPEAVLPGLLDIFMVLGISGSAVLVLPGGCQNVPDHVHLGGQGRCHVPAEGPAVPRGVSDSGQAGVIMRFPRLARWSMDQRSTGVKYRSFHAGR